MWSFARHLLSRRESSYSFRPSSQVSRSGRTVPWPNRADGMLGGVDVLEIGGKISGSPGERLGLRRELRGRIVDSMHR